MQKNKEDLLLEAKRIAQERHELHETQKSHRPLSVDYELIGILGEIVFADAYGFQIDSNLYISGDKGIDFSLLNKQITFTIDVKTAKKPNNLIVEVGKVKAKIYVLARYNPDHSVLFLGWHFGTYIKKAKQGCMPGYKVLNHIVSATDLFPMSILESIILTSKIL